MWHLSVLVSVVVVVVLASVSGAPAGVVIETVTVGNPGNAPDTCCSLPGYGDVSYHYRIGKYEITSTQYTDFLTAVASEDDPHGLWDFEMWFGPRILRGNQPDGTGFFYVVAWGWEQRPVTLVSWGDAARFCNWLHNGQPTGPQDLSTTEDGSYFLDGATSNSDVMAVVREPDATWVIPTENEWYKAAYHKNDGVTGNYYGYPTSSNDIPSNELITPDPGNNANFFVTGLGWTIGWPYYVTEIGAFSNSSSPYGTFDQGGNAWEWSEAVMAPLVSERVARGGSEYYNEFHLRSSTRAPWPAHHGLSLRVVVIPWFDIDEDGDADLRDFALFQAEFTGTEDGLTLADYARFQASMTGP